MPGRPLQDRAPPSVQGAEPGWRGVGSEGQMACLQPSQAGPGGWGWWEACEPADASAQGLPSPCLLF